MSKKDSSDVTTPNSGVVAQSTEDSVVVTMSKGDEEMKSTKEETQERTGGDLHPDNDNVSFLLEEPRSSLKKGFNIEVGWLSG